MTAPRPASFLDGPVSPLDGSPLRVLCADEAIPAGAIAILVDREARLPDVDPANYDALLTTVDHPPRPWVGLARPRLEAQLDTVRARIGAAPIAAALLARVLRIGEQLSFDTGIEVESLAYSTLLGGAEFARWLARRVERESDDRRGAVRYQRDGDVVTLTLDHPPSRNAMTAAMRDALYEALAATLDDPSRPRVIVRGAGRCFSTGGHLPEFGSARDLAQAHAVRVERSAARLIALLGERCEVRLHGACIGSGIEIAAAAARRVGAPDTFVQLPELAMGLIPGAGGTVTLPRAIGRHRTAWLALGGFRLGAQAAQDWGLLHEIGS